MDEIEQAAWEESQPAAAPEEETAAEEVAVESEEVVAAEESAADEPAEEVAEEAAEEEVQETAADEEDFQDLLDPIPTPESLLAKHARIPQVTKDELVNLATLARDFRGKIDELGGDEGLEALKPMAALIANPNPNNEDTATAFAALTVANPDAAYQLLLDGAAYVLKAENEMSRLGDRILQDAFGDGITREHIQNLIRLEQAGYYEVSRDLELLNQEGSGSNLYQKQEAKIAELETHLRQAAELIKNPEKILQQSQVKASDEFEKDFESKLGEAILPFVERARWSGDSAIANLVKKAVVADLKTDPAFKQTLRYVQQTGHTPDKIPFAVKAQMQQLISKGKGQFANLITEVNKQLKGQTETSRNAIVKEKIEKVVKPKSEPLKGNSSIFQYTPVDDIETAAYKEAFG